MEIGMSIIAGHYQRGATLTYNAQHQTSRKPNQSLVE